jgi:ATP-dependent exoDNAse (exonuclease V) alpha subunit
MPIFKIGDNVKAFNGQTGVVVDITSRINPAIHKKEEVQMIVVLVDTKEKEFYYRDLKHN